MTDRMDMSERTGPNCPGAGKCHGPVVWCADCDVTALGPCDMRARGERCDAHPGSAVLRPLVEEARHAVTCLDEDTRDAMVKARVAEATARQLRSEAERVEIRLVRATSEADHLQAQLTAALADERGSR